MQSVLSYEARTSRTDAYPQSTTLLLAIAATAIGVAIQIHDGEFHPTTSGAVSIGLITLAIAAAGVAVSGPKWWHRRPACPALSSSKGVLRSKTQAGRLCHEQLPRSKPIDPARVGSAPPTDSQTPEGSHVDVTVRSEPGNFSSAAGALTGGRLLGAAKPPVGAPAALESPKLGADPARAVALDISNDLHAGAKRRQGHEAAEKPQHRAAPDSRRAVTVGVLSALLTIQLAFLLFSRPDSSEHSYLLPGLHSLNLYHAGIALAAVIAAAGVGTSLHSLTWQIPSNDINTTGERVRWPMAPQLVLNLVLAAELVLFTALGAWSLGHTSVRGSDVHPHIDVFVFQQQAARALLHGRNPYSIDDFPDIYADPATGKPHQEVYGPGMSDGHVLHFGFPYLPASLYFATLGYAATGDHRTAQLAALALSAVLIYLTGSRRRASCASPTPGRSGPGLDASIGPELPSSPVLTSALAAALLLFTPRAFFVLISGWTEPFLVLWLSAAVYCACRRPRLLPIALGLLLATKQYMALAVLPASVLLVPRDLGAAGWHALLPRWRDWIKLLATAAVVAVIVSAPLALWDLRKFYFSVVTVQRYAPFRWDALSYLTWHAFGHGEPSPGLTVVLPGVMAAAAIALCLWRAPRTPAGFAASVGFIMLVFFAFSKQAFANYYFFVIGALCCAVAASGKATDE